MSVYGNPAYCGCDSFVPPGPQYPYSAPSGWFPPRHFPPEPCGNFGPCPIMLDFNCSIYHKDGSQPNNLAAIGLNNGATLQLFADTIAPPVGLVMNVPNYSLPILRGVPYVINNLQQFAQAVDTEFGVVLTSLATIGSNASAPIVPVQTNSVHLTVSGTLGRTLQADVNISAQSGNDLSILSDGLFAAPQTLSINASAGTLTISNGNTVTLTSILCPAAGFLGNLSSDPSSFTDGQYWWNTTSSLLKISVNGGTIKVITTT